MAISCSLLKASGLALSLAVAGASMASASTYSWYGGSYDGGYYYGGYDGGYYYGGYDGCYSYCDGGKDDHSSVPLPATLGLLLAGVGLLGATGRRSRSKAD